MPGFTPGQRVHHATDPTRTGTVHYTGPVKGHAGDWVGVDWDNGAGKHDGSVNGVRYFQANGEKSGSFVREGNLRGGVGVVEAVTGRYRGEATKKEDEDEMYVLSASNNRVSVQFVGKDKIQDKLSRFDELERVSLAYLGVSSAGSPNEISKFVPNLKELDLTGNLLSDWKDVGAICEELPALAALNLSNNLMSSDVPSLLPLRNLSVLVLNYTGIKWAQIESLKGSLVAIKELHLMGNQISEITPASSNIIQGFDSLRVLNLEENCISEWDEILKLSELASLEQLHLNKNSLHSVFYPCNKRTNESLDRTPFKQLSCLLLGANRIADLDSVDALNSIPRLTDIRLSENPISDPGKGGISRFALIARLAKIEVLNGSEVTPRERKESEIRYVRMVMSRLSDGEDIAKHPR
ncbi:Tubulin-folding cofactor E-like protein [Drosera capensis]